MINGKRDIYASDFKLKFASEAMSGDKIWAQLANEYHVHPFQIIKRKEQLKALPVPFHRTFSEKHKIRMPYPHSFNSVRELRKGLDFTIHFHHFLIIHQALDYKIPN